MKNLISHLLFPLTFGAGLFIALVGLDEGVTVAGLPLGDGVEALMPPDRRVILVAERRRVLEDETDTDEDDSVAVAVADAPAD